MLKLLTDQPIRELDEPARDGLGFNTYAEVLASATLGTPGPFTIGVFGEWGTGKTSLMSMICRELLNQPDVVTVWFNAWRFEQEQHPIVPLVATIVRGLESHKSALQKLEDKGKALLTALRAIAYGFSGKAKIALPGFPEIEASFVAKDMIEREEQIRPDPLLDRSLYYDAFERLSKIKISGELKIVVLVDDLDRCFPDRAIALLESIKLVLSQPGFVFILGVSRRVIEGYLQHRYEQEFGIKHFRGADYLDKIVQLPFNIPPHQGRMKTFSESLLQQLQPTDRQALQTILPVVGAACGNNPRATVRFVNNILIDKAIHRSLRRKQVSEELAEEVPILYFAITRALQQRWWDIFALLTNSAELCATIAQWDRDSLREFSVSKDPVEAEVATRLMSDMDLQTLLFRHGKEWLKNEKLRGAAVQFLWERRPEAPRDVDHAQQFQTVVLVHAPEDREKVLEIAAILQESVPGVMRASTHRLPSLSSDVVVIWIIGSDWTHWEDGDVAKRLLVQLQSNPLFVILLPEAKKSRVWALIPGVLTIQLSEWPVQAEDLGSITLALERFVWTRTRV